VLGAERARGEQGVAELSAAHEARVAELATEARKLAEERTRGWAHLPLPDLVRQALEEGLNELVRTHADELSALKQEQEQAQERLLAAKDDATAEGRAALVETAAAAEQEMVMALGEARLQHEEERTRFLEEINKRTEAELAALRDEVAEASRRHLVNETRRITSEEGERVAAELQQLRREISLLEADKLRGERLRSALAQDADAVLAAEVTRLEGELQATRVQGDGGGLGRVDSAPIAKPPKEPIAKPQTPLGPSPRAGRKPASSGRPPSRGKPRPS